MQGLRLGLVISNQTLWDEVQAALREIPAQVVLQQHTVGDWAVFTERLAGSGGLDAVLFDLADNPQSYEQAFRIIRSAPSAPAIVALNVSADSDTILGAMRAGATEYLFPPFGAALVNALQRIAADRLQANAEKCGQSARTVGIFSTKGGCGGTTIACHLGIELQRATSTPVLIADFDLASGLVGFVMKSKSPYSILDAVQNVHRLDPSFWKAIVSNGRPQIEVLSAPPAGSVREWCSPGDYVQILRFARTAYRWIVADFGRGFSPLSLGVLDEIDDIFLVAQLDLHSLHQAKQIVRNLSAYGIDRSRLQLILNRVPKNPEISPGEVEKLLDVSVYCSLPECPSELIEAYSQADLVGSDSELGKSFSALAAKISGVRRREKAGDKSSTFSFF